MLCAKSRSALSNLDPSFIHLSDRRATSNLTLECKNILNYLGKGRQWKLLRILRSTLLLGKIHTFRKFASYLLCSHFLPPPLVDHTRSDITFISVRSSGLIHSFVEAL